MTDMLSQLPWWRFPQPDYDVAAILDSPWFRTRLFLTCIKPRVPRIKVTYFEARLHTGIGVERRFLTYRGLRRYETSRSHVRTRRESWQKVWRADNTPQ